MELVGFSALPYCLLLLAVFTTQQFRSWPAHVPITEREGGLFRHYCFGCPRRYALCASAYFCANAAFYLLLFGIASLAGLSGGASMPWLLLVLAIVIPDLPGLNRPRNQLRYLLQRYVFRPALPSPTEARLWRELSREAPIVPTRNLMDESGGPDGLRNTRNWEHLLFLTALLQRLVENNSERRHHAEVAELAGFVRQKTHALERRGVRNAELLELLLGCCYLALARLIVHDAHSEQERRARLGELGLQR